MARGAMPRAIDAPFPRPSLQRHAASSSQVLAWRGNAPTLLLTAVQRFVRVGDRALVMMQLAQAEPVDVQAAAVASRVRSKGTAATCRPDELAPTRWGTAR